MSTFLKLLLSLECKYNELQFGIRIGSIEVGKQKLHISIMPCLQQNLQKEIHPGVTPFSREKGSECFPVSIGVCAAFPSRGASRNSSKGVEETLIDRVASESALFARVTI